MMIALINDHIYKSVLVFDNMKTSIDDFEFEAQCIEYVKCALLNKEAIDDFNIFGVYVDVSKSGDDYYLCSDIEDLRLETDGFMILDYNRE